MKRFLIFTLVLLLLACAVACGGNNGKTTPEQQPTADTEATPAPVAPVTEDSPAPVAVPEPPRNPRRRLQRAHTSLRHIRSATP